MIRLADSEDEDKTRLNFGLQSNAPNRMIPSLRPKGAKPALGGVLALP